MSKPIILGSSVLVFLLAGVVSVRAEEALPSSQLQYSTQISSTQQLIPILNSEHNQELINPHLKEYAATDAVPVLQVGSRGKVVENVQKFLKQAGAYTGEIDGVFGSESEAAVTRFQQQANLTPDGIIGIKTWRAMLGSQVG